MRLQWINVGLTALIILGLTSSFTLGARILSGTNLSIRIQQCREGCLEKFAIKEDLCQQRPECSTNGFPPYNYNSLPDALHLLCWDECAKPPPPKINKSIRETWALHTVSMLQQDSLVLVDVAWAPLNTPNQCLVTWEVSGGGLMGNLLTESFNVQLSLWPDTKYRVQVTCKNNNTSAMSRSLPLTIDTAEAITLQEKNEQQQKHSSTTLLPASGYVLKPDLSSEIKDTSISSEDQSNEAINQHTNFIFNWHQKNNDISRIEPIKKPDFSILTIAALSDIQKSMLFGIITGAILLAIILSLFVCMLRNQRVPNDKAALIAEDANVVGITVPVSVPNSANSISSSSYASDPTFYTRTLHHVLKV